jgi:hypothetical protein
MTEQLAPERRRQNSEEDDNMTMKRDAGSWVRRIALSVAVLALLGLASAPDGRAQALADVAWRGHGVEHWRHGDIRSFHERDLGHWRGGRWFHGDHLGRLGWWWIVDGTWFSYPAPIYPYPDPYLPSAVVAQTPPPASAPAYWYYCASVKTYYPYVTACPEGWMQVVPRTTPQGE